MSQKSSQPNMLKTAEEKKKGPRARSIIVENTPK